MQAVAMSCAVLAIIQLVRSWMENDIDKKHTAMLNAIWFLVLAVGARIVELLTQLQG